MRYGRAGLWLLAALVLMTGCAGGNPSDEKQWVELTYVTNLEDAEQLLTLQEPLLEQKGIRLTRLELAGGDPTAALAALMESGQTPDLMLMEGVDVLQASQWAQEGTIRTIPSGKLKTRSTLWEHSGDWARALTREGAWIALPVEAWNPEAGGSDMMIYCRTDWAKNLGVEDLSHLSWADFLKLARGYAHGDPDYNGIADTWGLTYAGPDLGGLVELWYGSFGVTDWSWQGESLAPGWSGDEAREATQWLVQLRREGILDPEGASHTGEEALELFCRGYAGMILWDDPAALESCWRDVQATREKAMLINDTVTVLALPENPYGITAMGGDGQDGPLAMLGPAVSDETLEKLLSIMEEVGKLAWQLPESLPEDASFTQRCAYRKRLYYRPYQHNAPDFTLAMDDGDLAQVNQQQREQTRQALAGLIADPGSFETLWSQWADENEALCGAYTERVNAWAGQQGIRP